MSNQMANIYHENDVMDLISESEEIQRILREKVHAEVQEQIDADELPVRIDSVCVEFAPLRVVVSETWMGD